MLAAFLLTGQALHLFFGIMEYATVKLRIQNNLISSLNMLIFVLMILY
uniref:Uncharacterized protein n=1 Tax=Kalanchoe fedtschenkoi TaxID=63787 RepID=A0A7N0VM73_KALFE